MTNKNILIIDDETQITRAIETYLMMESYRPFIANNGAEALKIICEEKTQNNPIHMIVTDLQMPVMNGLQLINELEKLKIDTPVLVMTGFGTKEIVIELLRKGIKDYIDKPFEPLELIQRINRFFKKLEHKENSQYSSNDSNSNEFLSIKKSRGLLQIEPKCDYKEEYQQEIRKTFLDIIDNKEPNIQIDFKSITEVDITLLNALISFAENHAKTINAGSLEIINVSKDVIFLFLATDINKLYKLKEV